MIWSLTGNLRAAPLQGIRQGLRISPVTLLELHFLREVGRLTIVPGHSLEEVCSDPRWKLDSPSSSRLFRAAHGLDWTRDPFDRLLVAHARYRGWRLATGDGPLREQLAAEEVLAL